jgi:hypothetical protein
VSSPIEPALAALAGSTIGGLTTLAVTWIVFAKFRELGSARQLFLWLRSADTKMPIVLR